MIQISPEQFENILPLAVEWAKAKEKVILEHGVALSLQYMEDAKSVGGKFLKKSEFTKFTVYLFRNTPY